MQYLLSKQEYDDLLARAKTPEQVAATARARTEAAAAFLDLLSLETRKVAQIGRLSYADPLGADHTAQAAAEKISAAISPFLVACGVDPGMVFNQMKRPGTHSASSA